ncbi:MAG: hypothetical protein KC462_05110, partial [Cyanobacteria bacterium HKST-UBA05]|nr:hypothetical protein [Cyanobacteria bacterium HKST-UBA05]
MQALLSLLLLIALLWPGQFLLVAPPAAWAGASQKQLQEKQKKLERIRNLKKQVILKEKRVTTNILRNQKRIESTATSLKQKAEQLEQAKGGLTSLEKQLDVALGEQKKLSDEVGHRLRSFYMGEHLGMLDVLLDAANISTF